MIDKILEFSVRQRVLVLMGALALLLCGLWSATKLPMDAIPDITGVQVQVNTTVPALAPDEVEKLVTVPLEMALGGVAGVTANAFAVALRSVTDHTSIHRQERHLPCTSARDRAFAKRGRFSATRAHTQAHSDYNRTGRSILLHHRLRTECAKCSCPRARRS